MTRAALPPGQQLAAPGKWPVVGERAPAAGGPWRLTVCGEVARPLDLSLDELLSLPQREQSVDIHCVTRWSKPGARFSGVELSTVLDLARPTPAARFVSFQARSEHHHSTSLALDEARQLGSLLALFYEGLPLPTEHGGPLRVVVPGKYFYKSLKWLVQIELLATDRPGYWESNAGYHNGADPWAEERYISAGLSRAEAATILAARDLTGRNLLNLDAGGRRLSGLVARGATLRHADFRGCDLTGAVFDGANLTNARFERAVLTAASFVGADVEGANFEGADLCGANLSGASLGGATFVDANSEAPSRLDRTTQFDRATIDELPPLQREMILAAIEPHSEQ